MKVSYKVLFAAVLSIAGTNAFAATSEVSGLATTNYVKGAMDAAVTTAGTNADTKVGALKTELTNGTTKVSKAATADSANAVAAANVTGLSDAVKAVKVNNAVAADSATKATQDASGNVITATYQRKDAIVAKATDVTASNATSETMYPSMAAAGQIAANAVAQVVVDLGDLQTEVTDLTGTVNSNKTAAENAIKGLSGTVTGTTGVVKTISQTNGKITATRATIDNADISAGTIAKDKLAAAVQGSLDKADSALQKSGTLTKDHVLKVDASGNVVDGGALGTMATENASNYYQKNVIGDGYTTTATVKADIAAAKTAASNASSAAATAETNAKAYADGLAKNYATAAQGTKADSAVQSVTGSNGVSASKSGTTVTVTGTVATANAVGVVKPGTDLSVNDAGALSVSKSTTVASGDTKPVTSGAVYTAVEGAKSASTTAVGNLKTELTDGTTTVAKATNATNATNATSVNGTCPTGSTNCAYVNVGGTKQWLAVVDEYK